VRVTVVAGELSGPVRLELKYDPARVPEGVPEEALFIARYDEASGRWVGLMGSQADPQQQRVAVEVEHFSVFQVLSFALDRVVDTVMGSFQAVFGGDVKVELPVCGRADDVLVQPVGEAWQVLLACAERDGDNIVLKVANNRSYGLILGYPGHMQVEVRQVPGNLGLTDAISELGSRIDAWVLLKVSQGLAGIGSPSATNRYIYLPPGGLVTLRGAPWEGTRQIEGVPSITSLAIDSVLAGVNAIRTLAIVHTGKDPGLLPLLGEKESEFVTVFDGMFRCLSNSRMSEPPPRWGDVRSCVFLALQLKLREYGLSALAALLKAPQVVADLGTKLTSLVQVGLDALSRTKWPALLNVTISPSPSVSPGPVRTPSATPRPTAVPSPTAGATTPGRSQQVGIVGQIGGGARAVAVQGRYAYLGVGPRLVVVDVADPARPVPLGQTDVLPGVVSGVAVAGGYAYVAAGEGGLVVVDVTDPAHPRGGE